MRIAQVAPLTESVPPRLYGGTERVVSYLTEELVRLGHQVTLFASGDSETSADLAPGCPRALRLDGGYQDALAPHLLMVEQVARRAAEFDVIHFHLAHLHFPVVRRLDTPHATTLHGRLDFPELNPLYEEFSDVPVVAISDAQRRPLPSAQWIGTVYHGLPPDLLQFNATGGDYLAFLGRFSPEKRVDRAIAIAKALGWPLRIAAKVDPADLDYFTREVQPLLDDPSITVAGEIGEDAKSDFLGHARALLFPIDWPEPFGLVMIESLACGTPVVAFRGGSVDEVLTDGVTGFVVDTVEAAIEATRRIGTLDRSRCRAVFEERFTSARMAEDYLLLYQRVIETWPSHATA
jgi:glycosyltransferase involved in cell wall biosynthesis